MKSRVEDELHLQLQLVPEGDRFSFLYNELRPHLIKHASAVCKNVLRQVEEHLVEEMVDDLLLEIDTFKGVSKDGTRPCLFTTWAHSRFRYRCIDELRYRASNLGEPLSSDIAQYEIGVEDKLSLSELRERLTPQQQSIVQARLEGYTLDEIAAQTGMDRVRIHRIWHEVTEGLGAQK